VNRRFWLIFAFFLITPITVLSQAICPASVILALARAGSACLNTGRDQLCHGNGSVTAAGFGGDVLASQEGTILAAESVQTLTLAGSEEYSVALLRVQGALSTNDQRNMTFLAFGDVMLENLVEPNAELLITATGTLNVRELPSDTAPILAQVSVRESLTAIGRLADNSWFRVIVPGEGDTGDIIGWVVASSITTLGNLNALNQVDPNLPHRNPFQEFRVQTAADDAPCAGTPESGLLLQTPNVTTPVRFSINDILINVAGTIFLQANPDLVMHVLDGEAIVSDAYYPAGSSMGADYDQAELAPLPINNFPVRFIIPAALSADQVSEAQAAYLARFVTPTPVLGEPTEDTHCRRVTRRPVDLRAGPGMNFEIVNQLAADQRVAPILAVPDADGNIWWQLSSSNWIRASFVAESGICPEIATTSYAPPPSTNHLSLETCESDNGAIRAGQTVTIDFVPPAFETIGEAHDATLIDPGRISVENIPLYVRATAPQPIGLDRYIRVFSATWRAEAGRFRIVGDRLSYEVICDITVPVG
jgi:hypothetical protein